MPIFDFSLFITQVMSLSVIIVCRIPYAADVILDSIDSISTDLSALYEYDHDFEIIGDLFVLF